MRGEPSKSDFVEEFDFRDLLFLFWKQKILIVFSVFVFFCFSIFYIYFSSRVMRLRRILFRRRKVILPILIMVEPMILS